MTSTNRDHHLQEDIIRATQKLHEIGQGLWLDNITRGLLSSGTLDRYVKELSVTELTSNPTIFDGAIENSHDYDEAIHRGLRKGEAVEELFFELAIEDLRQDTLYVEALAAPFTVNTMPEKTLNAA